MAVMVQHCSSQAELPSMWKCPLTSSWMYGNQLQVINIKMLSNTWLNFTISNTYKRVTKNHRSWRFTCPSTTAGNTYMHRTLLYRHSHTYTQNSKHDDIVDKIRKTTERNTFVQRVHCKQIGGAMACVCMCVNEFPWWIHDTAMAGSQTHAVTKQTTQMQHTKHYKRG